MNFDDFGVPEAGILKNSDRGIKVQTEQESGGPLLAFHMHPVPGYGEMKGESSDLVRYMLSGSKTIFREFF